MRQITSVLVASALSGAIPAMAAEPLIGKWNAVDEKSGEVRSIGDVDEQGGKMVGEITGRGVAEKGEECGGPGRRSSS